MSICLSCGIRKESIWHGNGHCSVCEGAYLAAHGKSISQVVGKGCDGGPSTILGSIVVVGVWILIAVGIVKLFSFIF